MEGLTDLKAWPRVRGRGRGRRSRMSYIDPISARTRSQNNIDIQPGNLFSIGLNMFAPVRKRRMTSYSTSSGEGGTNNVGVVNHIEVGGEVDRVNEGVPGRIKRPRAYRREMGVSSGAYVSGEEEVWVGVVEEKPQGAGSESEGASSDSDSDSSSSSSSSSDEGESSHGNERGGANEVGVARLKGYCSDVEEFDSGTESEGGVVKDTPPPSDEDEDEPQSLTVSITHPVTIKSITKASSDHAPTTPTNISKDEESNDKQVSHTPAADPVGIESLPYPPVGTAPPPPDGTTRSPISSPAVGVGVSPISTATPLSTSTTPPTTLAPQSGHAPSYTPPILPMSAYFPSQYYQRPFAPNSNMPYSYQGGGAPLVQSSTPPTLSSGTTPPLLNNQYRASYNPIAMLQYMHYYQQQQLLRGMATPAGMTTPTGMATPTSVAQYQQQQAAAFRGLHTPSPLNLPYPSVHGYQWPPQQQQTTPPDSSVAMTTDTPTDTKQDPSPSSNN